jgi:GAF domain-containing protein
MEWTMDAPLPPESPERLRDEAALLLDELKALNGPHDAPDSGPRSLFHGGARQGSEATREISARVSDFLVRIGALLRQVEDERGHFEALQRVSSDLSSTSDRDELLPRVMDELIRAVGAERGFLMLLDDASELELKVARGKDGDSLGPDSFRVSQSIVSRVVDEGRPILTDNARDDPRFAARESVIAQSFRSILCVPLRAADRLIGVVSVDHRYFAGQFSAHDRDILQVFANQAAIAIENARHFGSLRREIQMLRIEIDQVRQAQAVAEITETEFFDDLRAKARDLRPGRDKAAVAAKSFDAPDEVLPFGEGGQGRTRQRGRPRCRAGGAGARMAMVGADQAARSNRAVRGPPHGLRHLGADESGDGRRDADGDRPGRRLRHRPRA